MRQYESEYHCYKNIAAEVSLQLHVNGVWTHISPTNTRKKNRKGRTYFLHFYRLRINLLVILFSGHVCKKLFNGQENEEI